MKKKVLIAAGGTGGHIFPAFALAEQLAEDPKIEVAFAGGNLSQNRYFDRGAYRFYSTPCAHFVRKNPIKLGLAIGKIGYGIWKSRQILKEFQPDLAVGFGSYYTFPILIASLLRGIPLILHEANSIPGKVNRLLSRYAQVTGMHFPVTKSYLSGPTELVGMPLRKRFKKGTFSLEEARAYFQISPILPTLLVFGGSQGSQAINRALMQALELLKNSSNGSFQLIHLTGSEDEAQKVQRCYKEWKIPAAVKAFETRMELAWQAADMVISRAGAGTISEAIEFEVPALLIPFPQAADNHQEINADFMEKLVKGGQKMLERELDGVKLMQIIRQWLLYPKSLSSSLKLQEMRTQMSLYKEKSGHLDLAKLIYNQLLTLEPV